MPTRWLKMGSMLSRRSATKEGRRQQRAAAKASGAAEERTRVRDPRWAVVAALLLGVLHLTMFPPLPRISSDFPAEGEIAGKEIRAPFAFDAPLLEEEVARQQFESVLLEPPVVKVLSGRERDASLSRLETFHLAVAALADSMNLSIVEKIDRLALQFPNQNRDRLQKVLNYPDVEGLLATMATVTAEVLIAGVVDFLPFGNYTKVRLVQDDTETLTNREDIIPQTAIENRLTIDLNNALNNAGLSASDAGWFAMIVRGFVSPNLIYQDEETKQRQSGARAAIATERDFGMGERIVDQGVRVTEQAAIYLATLQDLLVQRGEAAGSERRAAIYADRILLLALCFGIYGWLAWVHFPHMLIRLRYLGALVGSMALFLVGASVVLNQPGLGDYAVPITLLALLVTVLFKDVIGYATTLLAVGLLTVLPDTGVAAVFAWMALGLVTVVAVRRIQKRSQFYQTIGLLTLLSILLISLLRTAAGDSVADIGSEYLVALFTPSLTVAFALFLLPIVEPMVGVSSDLTLLELSDLNHPLLQKMALEAPGTFHHSQVVGQLAEAAARSIDANALLVRVGALFHDIGKLNKAEYFVENQRPGGGGNKHDELSPNMSALVIGAHVKDGIELGRRWRLPRAVIDFIPQHHGTQVMEFFYHKALEAEGNETVKVDDFRYPGPKPRSRETAILMLADAVEAATRSLAKPTPGRIKEITKQIVDKRMLSGELDESNLTLLDLARIRSAFIPLLTGIHHARIAYPGQKEKESERPAEKRSGEKRSGEKRSAKATERSGEPREERKTRT